MAPLIGITTSLSDRPPRRAVLNAAYIEAVQAAGGIPILLSPHLAVAARKELLAKLDGIVLTGGGDVDPALYAEEPLPSVSGVSRQRDDFEVAVLEVALGAHLPIFAICRGMQIVNVVRGGSLIQDIPSQVEGSLVHAQEADRPEPTHRVRVAPGSRLSRLLGAEALDVNSLHHQAVKQAGAGLVPVAWSEDGLVEGLEMPGYEPFFIAVQWHPEELASHSPEARKLFAALVAAASVPDS